MSQQFFCSTVLQYADRYEGQCLHVGDEKECNRTRDLLSAISVTGEMPERSWIIVAPMGPEPLAPGEKWRQRRNPEQA